MNYAEAADTEVRSDFSLINQRLYITFLHSFCTISVLKIIETFDGVLTIVNLFSQSYALRYLGIF